MRVAMGQSGASARDALAGLLSQEGGRLPLPRAIHEAAVDVEESLKFWKKIVKKIPSRHRVSHEFLNRQADGTNV